MPVTNTHPELKAWKYPLVGDKDVTMIERVVIDVNARKVIRLKMPPDQHRSTLCDDIACDGNTFADVEWSPDDETSGVCIHLARAQAGVASRGRCRDRRSARSYDREDAEVLRERQRQNQLALPPAVERNSVVQRTRQLGKPVPLRLDHRQAEESDHARPGKRNASAVCRRQGSRDLLRGRRQGERSRSILRTLLQREVRRHRAEAADAGERGSSHQGVARRAVFHRYLLNANAAAGNRGTRRRRQDRDGGGEAGYFEAHG